MVTVDKNAAYPVAMETSKGDETLTAAETKLRQSKYLGVAEKSKDESGRIEI